MDSSDSMHCNRIPGLLILFTVIEVIASDILIAIRNNIANLVVNWP